VGALLGSARVRFMLLVFQRLNMVKRGQTWSNLAPIVSNYLEISQEKMGLLDLWNKVSGYLHSPLRSREKGLVDLKALKLRKEVIQRG